MDDQVLCRNEHNMISHVVNYLQHVPLHYHVQVVNQRMIHASVAARVYAAISLSANFRERVKCHVVPCCECGMSHAVGALTQSRVRTPCQGYRNVAWFVARVTLYLRVVACSPDLLSPA